MKAYLKPWLTAAGILICLTAIGCEREHTEGEVRSPEPVAEPMHGTGDSIMPPPGAGVHVGPHDQPETGVETFPSEPGPDADPVAPPPVGRHGLEPSLGEDPPLDP